MLFRCSSIVLVVLAVSCIAAPANASTHVALATTPVVKKVAHEDAARQFIRKRREEELLHEVVRKRQLFDQAAWERIQRMAFHYALSQPLPSLEEFNSMKSAYNSVIAAEKANDEARHAEMSTSMKRDEKPQEQANNSRAADQPMEPPANAVQAVNPAMKEDFNSAIPDSEKPNRRAKSVKERNSNRSTRDEKIEPDAADNVNLSTNQKRENKRNEISKPLEQGVTKLDEMPLPSLEEPNGMKNAYDGEIVADKAKDEARHTEMSTSMKRDEKPQEQANSSRAADQPMEPPATTVQAVNQKRMNKRNEILKPLEQGATKLDRRIASLQAIVDIPGTLPPKFIAEKKQKLDDLQKQRETEVAAKRQGAKR